MLNRILACTMLSIFFVPASQAATEYLRFEGTISPDFDEQLYGYAPNLNFQPGQQIYFDFEINTAAQAQAQGYYDSSYEDHFATIYSAGSIDSFGPTFGRTSIFPEGTNSWLFITDSLRVGTTFRYENGYDLGIATWEVGDSIKLLNYSYYDEYVIGQLTLTLRDDTLPPAIVPLPASLWLLGSGFVFLLGLAKRNHKSALTSA